MKETVVFLKNCNHAYTLASIEHLEAVRTSTLKKLGEYILNGQDTKNPTLAGALASRVIYILGKKIWWAK